MTDWCCLSCGSSNPPANLICGSVACQDRRLRDLPQTPATRSRNSRKAPATADATELAGEFLDSSSKASPKTKHQYPEAFEAFWSVYPLHKDKLAALGAWKRAVLRVSPDELREAAARFRNDPQRDPQFTKHAERWLNAGGWEDEAEVASPAAPLAATDWDAKRAEDDAAVAAILAEEATP